MSAYPGGHAGFLAVALATHVLVGYALGAALFDRPLVGAAAGVLPDADFLFPAAMGSPFAHRGLTHGLLFLGAAAALVAARDRDSGGAFAVASASHLLVDSTTPMGVPLLSPVVTGYVHLDVGVSGHSPPATAAVWAGCLALLLVERL